VVADITRSQSQKRHATTSPQRSHTLAQDEALDNSAVVEISAGRLSKIGREELILDRKPTNGLAEE
jgi:hypothetical protein